MKDRTKHKELLPVVLIAVMAAAVWLPVNRASFAEESLGGGKADHYAYITGYPDSEVKPLNKLTREEAAVIFYRLMPEEGRKAYASAGQPLRDAEPSLFHDADQPFADVDDSRWSADEIATLYNAKIIQGYGDGSFRPAEPVTRAEFAAMAASFEELKSASKPENANEVESSAEFITADENGFPDTENHWAKQSVDSAVEKGWIRVFGDGTFRPENNIIRCEAMMLVNDALDRRVDSAGLLKDAKQWPDCAADQWYYEIVMEAANTHAYERADRPKSTEKWTVIRPAPIW